MQIFVASMSRVVTWIFCCFLTPLVPPRDLRVFVSVECAECFTVCWLWIGGFSCVSCLWCAEIYSDFLFIVYAAACFTFDGDCV